MKIKPEYSLSYEPDIIYIVRKNDDGTTTDICPISETAAMAWDGIVHGVERDQIIRAIAEEFDGATPEIVEAELTSLEQQLVAYGYAEV